MHKLFFNLKQDLKPRKCSGCSRHKHWLLESSHVYLNASLAMVAAVRSSLKRISLLARSWLVLFTDEHLGPDTLSYDRSRQFTLFFIFLDGTTWTTLAMIIVSPHFLELTHCPRPSCFVYWRILTLRFLSSR